MITISVKKLIEFRALQEISEQIALRHLVERSHDESNQEKTFESRKKLMSRAHLDWSKAATSEVVDPLIVSAFSVLFTRLSDDVSVEENNLEIIRDVRRKAEAALGQEQARRRILECLYTTAKKKEDKKRDETLQANAHEMALIRRLSNVK